MVLHDKGSLLIDFILLFFFSFSLSHPFFHPRKGTIMYTNRYSKNRKSFDKLKATGWECSQPSTWSECKGNARLHFPILCLIRSSAIPLKSLSPSSSRCCDFLSCRPAIPSADLYLQPSPHRHIYFNGADNLPFISNDVYNGVVEDGSGTARASVLALTPHSPPNRCNHSHLKTLLQRRPDAATQVLRPKYHLYHRHRHHYHYTTGVAAVGDYCVLIRVSPSAVPERCWCCRKSRWAPQPSDPPLASLLPTPTVPVCATDSRPVGLR